MQDYISSPFDFSEGPAGLHDGFASLEFIERAEYARLMSLLSTKTATVGIAGTRGSGKTWLIRKAIDEVEQGGGLGLWFSCPSKYEESDFVIALFERLCSHVLNRLEREQRRAGALSRILGILAPYRMQVPMAASIVAIVPLALAVVLGFPGPQVLYVSLLGIVSLFTAVGLIITGLQAMVGTYISAERLGRRGLYLRSRQLLETLRYAESILSSASVEVQPVRGLKLGGQYARELTRRPLTFVGLIDQFRTYSRFVARTFGKLVIGVDELDKLHTSDDARALLRGIKGMFGEDGVSFLVSVSDEALEAFELRTLAGRDEVDSSFGHVIRIEPLSLDKCAEVLGSRGVGCLSRLIPDILGIVSAGNTRDLIRSARETYFQFVQNLDPSKDRRTTSDLRFVLEEGRWPPEGKVRLGRMLTTDERRWLSIPDRGPEAAGFAKKVVAHLARLESQAVIRTLRKLPELSDKAKKKIADELGVNDQQQLARLSVDGTGWVEDELIGGEVDTLRHKVGELKARELIGLLRRLRMRLLVMSHLVNNLDRLSQNVREASARRQLEALHRILILSEESPLEALSSLRDLDSSTPTLLARALALFGSVGARFD